jgi:hypothetical protein
MLAYFPVPYQDELLYSVIARYAVHTGQIDSQKAVLRDVYGSDSAVAIPDLPSHLTALTRHLEDVWSVTAIEIIKKHTLGPLYFPFLNSIQIDKILKSMHSMQGGAIHTRAGIAASSISQPSFFRYCPACMNEEFETLGEPYWNRIHQIVGVNVCLNHQCQLVSSDLSFHPKQKHLYQAAARTVLQKESIPREVPAIIKLLVGRFHEVIYLQSLKGHSPHQWTCFYQNLARQVGLMNGSRVDHAGIREKLFWDWRGTAFEDYFTKNSADWVVSLFRKHRKSFHPLRHLLVWCSILPEKSILAILTEVEKYQGNEPKRSREKVAKPDIPYALTQAKRQAWVEILKQNSGCEIGKIRSTSPSGAIYSWLYRNDRGWLMENRPPRVKVPSRYQVDYTTWDEQNIDNLESYKAAALKDESRQRLSRTFLIKQLQRSNSIEKHLADLHKTKVWLEANAESVEDFQITRICRSGKLLREQGRSVVKWRLLRLAGIRPEKLTPKIKRLIKKLENQHGGYD